MGAEAGKGEGFADALRVEAGDGRGPAAGEERDRVEGAGADRDAACEERRGGGETQRGARTALRKREPEPHDVTACAIGGREDPGAHAMASASGATGRVLTNTRTTQAGYRF